MIELTVLNDSNVELNTVDDGLIGLDVVMATGGGSEINNQNKTVTPTESEQSVTADAGYTGLGTVTVEGIDSEYVGSDVPRNTSSDLLTEGATVIAPSGYYENSATKTVQMGTAGTPTASKGAVSNHSVSVTPSVTNQAGYIYSETKTGTAVSVSASELVSGTKSISANGTEDVTNYDSVSVSVPNSYSASDEGKVVDSGALVSQTSATYTANDTYDTTKINSVTVNVSGGGGGGVDMFDFTGGNIQAIVGTGTQYILTDCYNTFGIFAIKMQSSSSWVSWEHYFSLCYGTTSRTGIQRNSGSASYYWYYSGNSVNIQNSDYADHNIAKMAFSNPRVDQPQADKALAIFAGYYNGNLESSRAKFTFYGLNILNFNDEYVARFMPWLENGVAGVKDLVSGTFYSNAGTGAFDYIDLQGVLHNG